METDDLEFTCTALENSGVAVPETDNAHIAKSAYPRSWAAGYDDASAGQPPQVGTEGHWHDAERAYAAGWYCAAAEIITRRRAEAELAV